MNNTTTENFWSVMRDFSWPEPNPVSYRLYHDAQGQPLVYTMEHLEGTYIEVDQITYIRGSYHVLVRNGQLIQLEPRVQVCRLQPDTVTGTTCDPRDVCVIVDSDRPHKKWKKQVDDID